MEKKENIKKFKPVDLLDENKCRKHILKELYPQGPECPSCKNDILDKTTLANFWGGKRCACKVCKVSFNARAETYLQDQQLTYSQVFMLELLIELKSNIINASFTAYILGTSIDTARKWIREFEDYER